MAFDLVTSAFSWAEEMQLPIVPQVTSESQTWIVKETHWHDSFVLHMYLAFGNLIQSMTSFRPNKIALNLHKSANRFYATI